MAAINGDLAAEKSRLNPPPPEKQALAKCDHTKTQLKSFHFYASQPREKKMFVPKKKKKTQNIKEKKKNRMAKEKREGKRVRKTVCQIIFHKAIEGLLDVVC